MIRSRGESAQQPVNQRIEPTVRTALQLPAPPPKRGYPISFEDPFADDPGVVRIRASIEAEVARVAAALQAGLDEAVTALVVDHLRSKGYEITKPRTPEDH
jgi:hypothetical protein